MKRVALMLAILGILCVAVGSVQAEGYHHGHGAYHGAYYGGHPAGYYHHGHPGASVWFAPPVYAPYPVYVPAYRYGDYCPEPYYGIYYQGRGLSIGVGF